MDRRSFLHRTIKLGGALAAASIPIYSCATPVQPEDKKPDNPDDPAKLKYDREADVIVIGGGMGGCATALAACRNGLHVIMTEETKWIGGQVAAQGVPPDEHQWIETQGAPASYMEYRRRVRDYYRDYYPLTASAKADPKLNPGTGGVSKICHEPKVTYLVLQQMLAPYVNSGHLTIMYHTKAYSGDMIGDTVDSITVKNLQNGDLTVLHGKYFVDATDLGELLPLTKTEYVTGAESKSQTGEMHAPAVADPFCNQAFTYCFAMDYIDGQNNTIEKPRDYEYWKNYKPQLTPPWGPGYLLNEDYVYPSNPAQRRAAYFNPLTTAGETGFGWWGYRKIINKNNFEAGYYPSDITMVNWPQNDYFDGNIIDVSEAAFQQQIEASKQLSLSLLYWLQTECPRRDGKQGWPGLRLRKDIFGTGDGLALYPYIRESRRIKSLFTITEAHVGKDQRLAEAGSQKAAAFADTVGVGFYNIDLHPTCSGVSYIDTSALQFQIPLGAMIPIRVQNLIPACKNIGTTHITNGCYRLHPVEWSIGEAAGCLTAYSIQQGIIPHDVREDKQKLAEFQSMIRQQGLQTEWK